LAFLPQKKKKKINLIFRFVPLPPAETTPALRDLTAKNRLNSSFLPRWSGTGTEISFLFFIFTQFRLFLGFFCAGGGGNFEQEVSVV